MAHSARSELLIGRQFRHTLPLNRSYFRNVRFFDEATPDDILGGLVQNGSLTEKNFLVMLDIVLVTTAPIRVSAKDTGRVVSIVDTRLDVRDYLISCKSKFSTAKSELWIHRILSRNVSGQENAFRDGIRARDNKCVILGIVNKRAVIDIWTGFEAAHIFPLEKESLWIEFNYGRWVTDMDDTVGVPKINSCQNGFLFREDIRSLFNQYLLSVNLDDNYKIIVFNVDYLGLDGRTLDPVCRNPADPHSVSDQLLRWHFRQSVVANMRGAGEPIFEHDFPPGTYVMSEIRRGPLAQEKFELELSYRLREVA
ncbi:hypothetical protein K440DRAFT_602229 [Wilcoxina mikolae CBS 423.85]|nr:hypothetical protein K440DRAFT_602229 [Wilcoxina mikolae CBS 423.85]